MKKSESKHRKRKRKSFKTVKKIRKTAGNEERRGRSVRLDFGDVHRLDVRSGIAPVFSVVHIDVLAIKS